MKLKQSSPSTPFLSRRMNYMTTIDASSITADQYNRFVSEVTKIEKTDTYHIQVLCDTMTAQELYAVCCALIGVPKNSYKVKGDRKPGIELKYGGTLDNKKTRDKCFDKLSSIVAYGPVVRADSTEPNYAYAANGQGFRFGGPVSSAVSAASSTSSSSALTSMLASKSSTGGNGSTTTYLLLAAAAIAVILIIKRKKKNG